MDATTLTSYIDLSHETTTLDQEKPCSMPRRIAWRKLIVSRETDESAEDSAPTGLDLVAGISMY